MANFNLELEIAKWVFKYHFTKFDMVNFAKKALDMGYDNEKVIQLAILRGEEIDSLDEGDFHDVILSINRKTPSKYESGLIIAKNIATQIFEGSIEPIEGAKIISEEIYKNMDKERISELREFYINYNNYEDINDNVAELYYGTSTQKNMILEYENNIIDASEKLISDI